MELGLRTQTDFATGIAAAAWTSVWFKHINVYPGPQWFLKTHWGPMVTATCSSLKCGPTICGHISRWQTMREKKGPRTECCDRKARNERLFYSLIHRAGNVPAALWASFSTWIYKMNKKKWFNNRALCDSSHNTMCVTNEKVLFLFGGYPRITVATKIFTNICTIFDSPQMSPTAS